MPETPESRQEEGQEIHQKRGHEGSYKECQEWVCITYKARSRYLAHEQSSAKGDAERR